MSAPSWRPITVVTVIRLFRSACTPTTDALGQPLRARRADVVGAERVEHRRAHLPHQHRGQPGAEHDRRHQHVLAGSRPGRRRTGRSRSPAASARSTAKRMIIISPSQKCGTDRPTSATVVAAWSDALPRRTAAIIPAEDADQRPEQDREERELERDRQARDDRVRDRQLPRWSTPEVAAQRLPDPLHVLHRQRLVEPVRRAGSRASTAGSRFSPPSAIAGSPGSARMPDEDERCSRGRRRSGRLRPCGAGSRP